MNIGTGFFKKPGAKKNFRAPVFLVKTGSINPWIGKPVFIKKTGSKNIFWHRFVLKNRFYMYVAKKNLKKYFGTGFNVKKPVLVVIYFFLSIQPCQIAFWIFMNPDFVRFFLH